jgi:hypothetical protein
VRGKINKIAWLSLTLVMAITILPSITHAPTTRIYCDPDMISGILPDDPDPYFDLEVRIADVVDLWSVGFTVDFRPFVKTIAAVEVTQGDFLEDSYQTEFNSAIDPVAGEVIVGYSRLPKANTFPFGPLPPVGVDGSGLLATIKFKVVSAGESPITLTGIGLFDREGVEMMGYEIGNSYFDGPTADLIRGRLAKRPMKVGETQSFHTKVKNNASVPLEVRAHWDMYRVEDNQRLEIYSGQTYTGFGPVDFEYLYVDEFDEWYYEWNNPPENLFGEPDGLYIEGDANAQWASLYSFEDIALGDRLIGDLILEGYTQYPNGATDAVDIDVYCIYPVMFSWFGSLWGTDTWDWHGVRWTADTMLEAVPALGDETNLNDMTVLVYNYHGDAPDVIRLDSMRIRVEFSKFTPVSPESFVLQPGEALELPTGYWTIKSDDVGKWITEISLDYRYGDTAWIQGEKTKTRTWWVTP